MYQIVDKKIKSNGVIHSAFSLTTKSLLPKKINNILLYVVIGIISIISLFQSNSAHAFSWSDVTNDAGDAANYVWNSATATWDSLSSTVSSAANNITSFGSMLSGSDKVVKQVLASLAADIDLAQIINQIASLTTNFISSGVSEGEAFLANGTWPLFSVLFAFLLVWTSIKGIMGSSGNLADLFKEILTLIIVAALFALFLQNYSEYFNYFIDTFNYIANIFIGNAGSAGSGGVSGSSSAEGNQVNGIIAVFSSFLAIIMTAVGQVLGHISVLDVGTDLLLLLEAVVLFVIIFSIVRAVGVYAMQFFLSIVLVAISAAFGPVMIPFGLWDKTSFLLDGWIKFLLVVGLYRVVGALIFALMNVVGANLSSFITGSIEHDGLIALPGLVIIYIFSQILVSMVKEMPSISAEIVTGFPKSIGYGNIGMNPLKG